MSRARPSFLFPSFERRRPSRGNTRSVLTSGDLVLEDDLDLQGETLLGEGKAGLFSGRKEDEEEMYSDLRGQGPRPKSGRHRGLSGPITSNLEESERQSRRMKHARPFSGRVPADLNENSLATKLEEKSTKNTDPSLDNRLSSASSRTDSVDSSSPLSERKVKTLPGPELEDDPFQGLLSGKDGHRPRTGKSRRHSNKEPEISTETLEYNVSKSSISSDQPPTRTSVGSIDSVKDTPPAAHNRVSSSQKAPTYSPSSSATKSKWFGQGQRLGDVDFGDVDDLENEVHNLDLGPRMPVRQTSTGVETKPIDQQTAVSLKSLIFGSATHNFSDEWRYQSFAFSDLPNLLYGIVQKKGGPCGVLASVQACLLQHLLFAEGTVPSYKNLSPTRTKRSEALATALANILWRAGSRKKATVALPSMRPHFPTTPKFKNDNLTETLILSIATRYEDLLTFLKQNITQFELDGTSGVVLALYSVVLTRGIAGVRSDMDEPMGKLMGAHGYCTQDMVNLFLVGRAVSNVFNDIMELDSGQGKITVLKGIPCRSEIGLLSLFEHYKSCQVGTYLKTPKNPIWVVCSESHFSVLFCLKRELLSDWKAERRFDLYYYDGLGKQDEEIRLTVDTSNRFFKPPSEDDLVPPLEHCIRTKWCDAEVDWNGTEPIL